MLYSQIRNTRRRLSFICARSQLHCVAFSLKTTLNATARQSLLTRSTLNMEVSMAGNSQPLASDAGRTGCIAAKLERRSPLLSSKSSCSKIACSNSGGNNVIDILGTRLVRKTEEAELTSEGPRCIEPRATDACDRRTVRHCLDNSCESRFSKHHHSTITTALKRCHASKAIFARMTASGCGTQSLTPS